MLPDRWQGETITGSKLPVIPPTFFMQYRSFFSFAFLVSASIACSEATNGTGMISKKLGQAARDTGTSTVDLAQLTSFGWDRFYAFKAGATREDVCTFIHANRNVCGRIIRIERAPSDHTFLVFALGGQVTHVEQHALSNGQFDFDFPVSGQPRERSVFKVRHSAISSGEALLLEPK